jgi:SNF2 family DNA or RNA helicase
LNIKLNEKIIKEICGTVSFKKGDSFYRANHVTIESYFPESCEATVRGNEDFHVIIQKDENGGLRTNCSCPKLASYQKDCQHVAAVLLLIYKHQRRGTIPAETSRHSDFSANRVLTESFLTLFNDMPKQTSSHQPHFEKREVIDAEFLCKLVTTVNGQNMFGIEVKIGHTIVQNIRVFLEKVKERNPCFLSFSFTYDPSLHCFQSETDAVVQQLIQVIYDEELFIDKLSGKPDYVSDNHLLLIPPSSWEKIFPILEKVPTVKLVYKQDSYEGLHLLNGPLPLLFDFTKSEDNAYQLKIDGLNRIVVLNGYNYVLSEGKLKKMKSEDCKRLSDLQKMIEATETNQISIPEGQVNFFLEKVVPGLKRLGDVQISGPLPNQFVKSPLTAKLYLDRVKNRLLVGLEFHYENIVFNPLQSREPQVDIILIRDVEKEEAILQMLEDSQFAKTDLGYFLHNEEMEYEFLYHVVPKLQKLVQIYATTAVRNRIFREARPQVRVKVKKERVNWLEFKFQMTNIPEHHIREVLLALEEKRKYYRMRNGSLLSLETREFKEINRFLTALPNQKEDLGRGVNLPIVRGLQLLDSFDGNAFSLEESFLQFLETIRNPGRLMFEVPKKLESILKDYQVEGFKWMKTLAKYGFGGILADDMGLGKSLQSITFILSELPRIRKKKLPVLILCPSSLTYNWLSEIQKFAEDLQAVVVDGNQKERFRTLKDLTDVDVLITSYPLLRRDIIWFEKKSFHTVFFDEAQAFKNPLSQTAKAVKRIKARYRFALTGTPMENSIEELWSIFNVVFPELFLGLKEYSHLSREEIARRIRPFLLRRLKEDVLSELPEKTESIDFVELLPDQKKLYAAYLAKLRHDTLKYLDKDTLRKNRIKILAGLTRLRQICCHPALFVDGYKGSSAKYEQLMRIVEESRLAGRRVLIFSQFTKMLELISRVLARQGIPFFYLDGQSPTKERVEICNRFNAGERNFFLISLKAGGTGLNLTGADTVILYDIWWNPAVEEQATDRAHRIGQKDVVQVIKFVSKGTIEEKINELQEKKRDLIEEIIDSEEKGSSALTEEDIREILKI